MVQEEWTDVQRDIWAREEQYLQSSRTGDFDLFITLWHEDFVGWPDWCPRPITKSTINAGEEDRRQPMPASLKVAHEPLSVQVYGDVAITFYLMHVFGTDEKGKAVDQHSRITHTWIHQRDTWVIVGGMSAPHTAEAE